MSNQGHRRKCFSHDVDRTTGVASAISVAVMALLMLVLGTLSFFLMNIDISRRDQRAGGEDLNR
jgi:hypothetical protein